MSRQAEKELEANILHIKAINIVQKVGVILVSTKCRCSKLSNPAPPLLALYGAGAFVRDPNDSTFTKNTRPARKAVMTPSSRAME